MEDRWQEVSRRDALYLIQRAVGELIPEARAAQTELFPDDQTIPIALELFYLAFAMKDAYARGGIKVAQRYAERMGLDAEQVEAFAWHRINEVIDEAVS
jgi:hypothetical protein